MKKTRFLTAMLLAITPLCFAQLKVDFNLVDSNGVPVGLSYPEPGFESFDAQQESNGDTYDLFRTVTYNTAWGSVGITVGSDANTGAADFVQVPQSQTRDAQIGNYDGTLLDLARDWVGIDTRVAEASPTTLTLTISGLLAGPFEFVSYHQDAADQTGKFNILVDGVQVATNVDIHSTADGENPGPNNPPFFVVTDFTSDGSTPTTISFQLATTNSANDSERFMLLNGFVLANQGEGLLVYSFDASPTPVFQGQTTTLSWVTRSGASVYLDLIGEVTANTTNGVGSMTIDPSIYFAQGTTNVLTLTAQDTNTFEYEYRSIQVEVLSDIASFGAFPPFIHAGDSSTLSWVANPTATITINQGIGNVNAQTDSNGNGSFSVSPTTTTTYTITVDQNSVISQSNVTVTVIPVGGTGTLTNNLIAYWPMDELQGTKTPDLINGYDLNQEGGTYPTLTNAGYRSNAFYFSGNGLLGRTHAADDLLPANKSTSFTISFWTQADGPPQDDRRIFAEGSTTSNNPLFTFDTMGGTSGDERGNKMSVYIRRADNVAENFHTFTSGDVFDTTWHHVAFVQSNGVRNIYVDAVLDSTLVTNAASAWHTNVFKTTSFGGIKRASLGSFIIGFVDDAAIWTRALSPTEVGELYLDGLNPNPGPVPLVINEFKSDFPAVVAGDTVRLHWNATSDATLSIDNGVGDVTGLSAFGVGETNLVINARTTFTLSASRAGDTPVTRTVSIGVVSGVASGWHLLDNFETYQAGPIQGQANKWIQSSGVASVVDRGGNKILDLAQTSAEVVSPGGLLAALPLNSLSLPEGQIGTLFFRIYASGNDPVSDLTAHAGITDHPTGFIRDWANTGPYLRLEKPATLVTNITALAPDGVGVARTNAATTLDYDTIYNVWIDVTNDVIASNDVFSIYVQVEGDASRTLLFENLRGDRNPNDATFNVNPELNKVFFALMNQNQGQDNLFVDDVYLGLESYLDTIPVPAGNFASTLQLSSPLHGPDGFTFSWGSEIGATYTVRGKANLGDAWQNLATGYPTGGATGTVTSYTDTDVSASHRFYQVMADIPPAIWSENFESGAAGWVVVDYSGGGSSTQWELGTPSNGPGAAHGGSNCYGTGLNADYALYTDTALQSPLIDLTTVTNQAHLEFWHYLDVEETDFGQVNILDQFDTIIAQPAVQQSGSTGGWTLLSFPLPAAALGQPIKLEFRMADADYFNAQSLPGWFIDDVSIR